MPVLTLPPPPPFTPEQEVRIREIVREEIKAWTLSTMTDGFGNVITQQAAIKRGATAYPYVISGGFLEKRVTKAEGSLTEQAANILGVAGKVAAVELLSQTEAADQDAIEEALHKPILPE